MPVPCTAYRWAAVVAVYLWCSLHKVWLGLCIQRLEFHRLKLFTSLLSRFLITDLLKSFNYEGLGLLLIALMKQVQGPPQLLMTGDVRHAQSWSMPVSY